LSSASTTVGETLTLASDHNSMPKLTRNITGH
jgi:hypothetical protein